MKYSSDVKPTPLFEMLKGIEPQKHFFCLFTTSNVVEPKPTNYELSNHRLRFMDVSQSNVYQQFDCTSEESNADFFKHLYMMTGQPDCDKIESVLSDTLGEKYFTVSNVIKLNSKINRYMYIQRETVLPLTKKTFQMLCFEFIIESWIDDLIDSSANISYTGLWTKIFTSDFDVLNIRDFGNNSLLATFYQQLIETSETRRKAMFELWRDDHLPLVVKRIHTKQFLEALQHYKYLKKRFLIYSDADINIPGIVALKNVYELSDKSVFDDMRNIKVSLQGRPPVRLFDLGSRLLPQLTKLEISQLFSLTGSATIGKVIERPNDNYKQRMFVIKELSENIHKYENHVFGKKVLDECQLKDAAEDIIIVDSETRMGKTEFLRSLAYTYDPTRVVLFINLSTCNKDIENNRTGPDGLTYFLNKANVTSDPFMTSAFYQDNSVRTVFLDDYHEILPKHRNKMKCLLEEMLSRNKIRLFITTNDYTELKKDLPRARRKMTLRFLPITDEGRPPRLDIVGWTPLHSAAKSGQINDVKTQLEVENIDVDEQTDDGITALMIASSLGYLPIVDLLLTSHANLSQADEDGKIALHFAAENGRLNILEQLLKKFSKPEEVINQKTLDGCTAITLACAYGYVYVVNFLLENGADASQPNEDEWCPFHFAAENGHLDIVKILATRNIDITQRNLNGDTALTLASASGHIDIVDFLLENNADPLQSNRYGCTALHLAAEHGHLNIVHLLLSKGIDVNLKTNGEFTAITLASACGHVDVVDFLLTKEANPFLSNRHGENSINIAAKNGQIKVLDLLSRRRIDVNHKGSGEMIHASAYEHTNVIEFLLEKGAKHLYANRDDAVQQ